MEKYINRLKNTFLIFGCLTLILFLLHENKLLVHDIKGYLMAFETILFFIFVVSLYSFFILSDIQKNKFIYLSWLNYILQILSLTFFIYWGIIKPDFWVIIYLAYFAIGNVFNLIIMTIIFELKKTGGEYFIKDWLLFVGLIVFYIVFGIINRKINS